MRNQFNLKHRELLLSDLAAEIQRLETETPSGSTLDIRNLCVDWKNDKGKVIRTFSVGFTVESLSNDLHWDEEGDYSGAYSLEVRSS